MIPKISFLLLSLGLLIAKPAAACQAGCIPAISLTDPVDSTRLAQLDAYWTALSRTVKEGDFEGYAALYHPDAVIVFASGENKATVPVAKALTFWKDGFDETKAGKRHDQVNFRFSQRIGDETTAHETGIFHFVSKDPERQELDNHLVHFTMLFVKKDGKWLAMMEHQKGQASQEEWEALE